MLIALAIIGYFVVALGCHLIPAFFPRWHKHLARKYDGSDLPPLVAMNVLWPLYSLALLARPVRWIFNRIVWVVDLQTTILLWSKQREVQKALRLHAAQEAKQLPAPIDIKIEEHKTTYRTADCHGCGRPL